MVNFFKLVFLCCCLAINLYASQDEDPSKSIACILNNPHTDQEFYELTSLMKEMRELLIRHGIEIPPLTSILLSVKARVIEDGLQINDAIFERLWREFEAYEQEAPLHGS